MILLLKYSILQYSLLYVLYVCTIIYFPYHNCVFPVLNSPNTSVIAMLSTPPPISSFNFSEPVVNLIIFFLLSKMTAAVLNPHLKSLYIVTTYLILFQFLCNSLYFLQLSVCDSFDIQQFFFCSLDNAQYCTESRVFQLHDVGRSDSHLLQFVNLVVILFDYFLIFVLLFLAFFYFVFLHFSNMVFRMLIYPSLKKYALFYKYLIQNYLKKLYFIVD